LKLTGRLRGPQLNGKVVSQTRTGVMLKAKAMLENLERDLRERLSVDLARVSAGDDSLYFYNTEHNPFDFADSRLSKRGGEAYELAQAVVKLRDELGEPRSCDAELLIEAIRRHADTTDQHRLGAKRLAQKLLADLEDRSWLTGR
jgi:hypothetical protein